VELPRWFIVTMGAGYLFSALTCFVRMSFATAGQPSWLWALAMMFPVAGSELIRAEAEGER
jgi:hypothetical protein